MVIKVKHLIQYLQENYNSDAKILLDKDGWEENIGKTEVETIAKNYLFYKTSTGDLLLNN